MTPSRPHLHRMRTRPIVPGCALRSGLLVELVVEAFNRRKVGSGPTSWVLGRELTDEEFDDGITVTDA